MHLIEQERCRLLRLFKGKMFMFDYSILNAINLPTVDLNNSTNLATVLTLPYSYFFFFFMADCIDNDCFTYIIMANVCLHWL